MLYVDTIQEMLMPDTNVSTPFIRRVGTLHLI